MDNALNKYIMEMVKSIVSKERVTKYKSYCLSVYNRDVCRT